LLAQNSRPRLSGSRWRTWAAKLAKGYKLNHENGAGALVFLREAQSLVELLFIGFY